jgi:fimbrial chaperone protein
VFYIVWSCFAPIPVLAGEFKVSPITLEFGQGVTSGVFTVTNEGQGKLNFQISVSRWTQGPEGKDIYTDTADIVFFPKIMTLERGEQRVIRAGLKGTQPREEKTYRIFIEQIPSRGTGTGTGAGAGIVFYIRFAPPIFVLPAVIKKSGVIEAISLSRGKITARVKNTGNVHLKVTSIFIKGRAANGDELFSKEIAGWYLLHHIARNIEVPFPQDKCNKLAAVEIEAKTENFNLNGKLDVQRGMCSP